MNSNIVVGGLTAALLALGSFTASAGVVITGTQTITNANRPPLTGQHNIMIEGNKEKIDTPDKQIITDLDNNMVFVVDPARKTYAEITFPPGGPLAELLAGPGADAVLTKTGSIQTVAGYKCDQYLGTAKVKISDKKVEACYSSSAPGAADFAAFQKNFVTKLGKNAMDVPNGMPLTQQITTTLDEESVAALRPAIARRIRTQYANSGAKVEKIEVTGVESKKLGDEAFQIPEGFTKEVSGLR